MPLGPGVASVGISTSLDTNGNGASAKDRLRTLAPLFQGRGLGWGLDTLRKADGPHPISVIAYSRIWKRIAAPPPGASASLSVSARVTMRFSIVNAPGLVR